MIFKEEFIIEANHQEAWNFFTDFPSPVKVLPGLVEVKETAPGTYAGAVRVGIGPCQFHFKGDMKIVMIDPCTNRVTISGGANDPALGSHFTATAYTQTLPHGPQHSRICLEVHVGLGGLLGKMGLFMLRPVAHQITQRYSQLVSREIKRRRPLLSAAS